jgi:hypothetical protein
LSDDIIDHILQLYDSRWPDYVGGQIELLRAYRQLTEVDAQRLVERARALPNATFEAVSGALACYWPAVIPHHELLARDIFTTPHAYRDADESVVDELLVRLRMGHPQETGLSRDQSLMALVWANGPRVAQQFAQWRADPPNWRLIIYKSPLDFLREAGWTLTADGKRRDLFLPVAHQLVRRDGAGGPVTVAKMVDQECPWCQRQLVDLFDFDLSTVQLAFMNLQGQRLRIRTCASCLAFRTHFIFAAIDMQGNAYWDDANTEPEYGTSDSGFLALESRFALGEKHLSPYEAMAFGIDSAQVGGHPVWLQWPDYPPCPECHELMTYMAQIDGYSIGLKLDGVFFAFLCADCGRAATLYQNT